MAANKVVLPAPLGPIRPTISPASTLSEASSTAFNPPNALERPATSSMTLFPREEAHQTIWQARHDQYQHDAVDDQAERLDVLQRRNDRGGPARALIDAGQRDGADQRAEDRTEIGRAHV